MCMYLGINLKCMKHVKNVDSLRDWMALHIALRDDKKCNISNSYAYGKIKNIL